MQMIKTFIESSGFRLLTVRLLLCCCDTAQFLSAISNGHKRTTHFILLSLRFFFSSLSLPLTASLLQSQAQWSLRAYTHARNAYHVAHQNATVHCLSGMCNVRFFLCETNTNHSCKHIETVFLSLSPFTKSSRCTHSNTPFHFICRPIRMNWLRITTQQR